MSILFSAKVFSDVINDQLYFRRSDPALNELLATAEKFFIEAKATGVTVSSTFLSVLLETSNDNVNWSQRTAAINVVAITSGTVLFASDFAGAVPLGRYARYSVLLTNGQGSANAYIELWVTGRDAR